MRVEEIVLPQGAAKADWEVELGVVIGTRARCVSEAAALSHVAGYCVVNDVSERAFQLERGGTWDKGKGCDTFGPVGPWLVTADEVPDPQQLRLWLDVGGERMQDGSSADMVFVPLTPCRVADTRSGTGGFGHFTGSGQTRSYTVAGTIPSTNDGPDE